MFDAVVQSLEPFSREFSRRGKQIYLVGGAVRNLLLGRPAKDYDFTTDALPSEVQSYFRKVLPTGLQHGTVTVVFQGQNYEVTTFRVDGGYTDGRRPDSVTFTPSLEEDLKRRDFTVNALALNLADGSLSDFHGGREDLHRRVIRAIGDPGTRFDEDALRLLRLFRFSAQLDFSVDPETLAAVPSRRANLAAVSRERVREELAKTLAASRPAAAWARLDELGFLADVFAPLELRRLAPPSLHRLDALAPDLRWAFWLTAAAGPGPERWEPILQRLTFSRADQESMTGPARAWAHLGSGDPVPVRAKRILEAWGSRDRAEPGAEYLAAAEAEGLWSDADGLKTELRRAASSGEPVWLKELALGGKDLLEAGWKPGPDMGRTLKALQEAVWADPALNSPQRLRERLPSLR